MDVGAHAVHAISRRRDEDVVHTRGASYADNQVDGFITSDTQERVYLTDLVCGIEIPAGTSQK